MKKFITPKDYPHDKCINVNNVAIIIKNISTITKFDSFYGDDKDTVYHINFYPSNCYGVFNYSCEKQRDQVFDMILEDLNKLNELELIQDDNINKEDLKCCGNCKYSKEPIGQICTQEYINSFCYNWEFDCLLKDDRLRDNRIE
jgi:hypothetical protein